MNYLSERNDDGHTHVWGPRQTSHITGASTRPCKVVGCSVVSMDDDELECEVSKYKGHCYWCHGPMVQQTYPESGAHDYSCHCDSCMGVG